MRNPCGEERRGQGCTPPKPLSPGLVPCGPVGINSWFTRFLQSIHKDLEAKLARFHQREDAILYPSCFDANAGLFEVCGGRGWELGKPLGCRRLGSVQSEPGRMPVSGLKAPVPTSYGAK